MWVNCPEVFFLLEYIVCLKIPFGMFNIDNSKYTFKLGGISAFYYLIAIYFPFYIYLITCSDRDYKYSCYGGSYNGGYET